VPNATEVVEEYRPPLTCEGCGRDIQLGLRVLIGRGRCPDCGKAIPWPRFLFVPEGIVLHLKSQIAPDHCLTGTR
jgi:hypothetical protein